MIRKTEKSVAERAAEAIDRGGSSTDLAKIRSDLTARIDELETAKKPTEAAIEKAEQTGNLDKVREAKQAFADLKDEIQLLRRQSSGLYRAVSTARGKEAIKATPEHRKALAAARDRALKAQDELKQAEAQAREICEARRSAAEIGGNVELDKATIRELAAALYPEGNSRKQLMIDLGIGERQKTDLGA